MSRRVPFPTRRSSDLQLGTAVLCDELPQRFEVPVHQGHVCRDHLGRKLCPGGLDALEPGALTGAVHADQRLQEEPIGDLCSLGTELADALDLLKQWPQLPFGSFMAPLEREVNVSALQRADS